MKKDRNARKQLLDLYFYLDNVGYHEKNLNGKDKERFSLLSEKYKERFSKRPYHSDFWYEYYGLFNVKDDVKIDPKRLSKRIDIPDEIIKEMGKRKTTFFHPKKREYFDYDVNYLVDKVDNIKKDFFETYKPIIDKSVKNIKNMRELSAGDYDNFLCGITGPNGASRWAEDMNYYNKIRVEYKKHELFQSLYAQFFHYMTSSIEAATISIYKKHHPKMGNWRRDLLYDNTTSKGISSRDLPSFKYHDELYDIWNFMKHNNLSTYEKLKKAYPEVLIDTDYEEGDLAVHYLKLDENLIVSLLDGVKEYFKEWCKLNLDEDYERAQWDYDKYFVNKVSDWIDGIYNPQGLTIYDELD